VKEFREFVKKTGFKTQSETFGNSGVFKSSLENGSWSILQTGTILLVRKRRLPGSKRKENTAGEKNTKGRPISEPDISLKLIPGKTGFCSPRRFAILEKMQPDFQIGAATSGNSARMFIPLM